MTGLHVAYVIDSLGRGGAERSLAQLTPELVAGGVRLDVLTLHDRPGLQADVEAGGATVTCLDGGGGRAGWFQRTRRALAGLQPDLVHTTLFEADVLGRVAARSLGIPVVTSVVNETYGSSQRTTGGAPIAKLRAAQAVDAATVRLARRVHAVSEPVARAVARDLRYPAERIDVVFRGRDEAELGRRTPERRAAVRDRLGVHADVPVVLAVGRTEPQKGLDVLLEALPTVRERFPAVQLLLAGRPARAQSLLDRLVAEHRLDGAVRFLGERDDVADLHVAADVFAFPSRWEGFPGSVVEAMALETPIVASDIEPVHQVLSDRGGELVPVDEPEKLAQGICRVLDDPGIAAPAELRARFLEHLTIPAVSKQLRAFYDRALAS